MHVCFSANNKPKRNPAISNPLKLFIEAGPSQNIRVTLAPHSWMFLHFNTFLKLKAPRRRKPFSRIFKDSGSSGNNTLAGAPRNRSLRGEGADACAGSIHVHLTPRLISNQNQGALSKPIIFREFHDAVPTSNNRCLLVYCTFLIVYCIFVLGMRHLANWL